MVIFNSYVKLPEGRWCLMQIKHKPHLAIQTCPLAAAQRLRRLTLVLSNTHRSGVCATGFWDIGPAGQQTWRSGKTTTAICKNNHYSNHYSKLPCQLCQFAGAWWGRSYKLLSKLVRSPVFLGIPWAWRMTILRNCKKSGQQPLRNKCQQNMRIPQIINSPRVSQNRNCKGTCRIYYIFWKTTVSVLFFHIYIYIPLILTGKNNGFRWRFLHTSQWKQTPWC